MTTSDLLAQVREHTRVLNEHAKAMPTGICMTPRQWADVVRVASVETVTTPAHGMRNAYTGIPVFVRDDLDDTPLPERTIDMRPSTTLRRRWAEILLADAARDRENAARHLGSYIRTLNPVYRAGARNLIRRAQITHAQAVHMGR